MKRTPLERKTPLRRTDGLKARSAPKPRKGISPASPAQRSKAAFCIVRNLDRFEATIDPAHLWPRGSGGCDDPLCVVGLERSIHRAFDDGEFELLPYLVERHVPELCHALEHADGNVVALLQRLTGKRWRPE